MKKVFICSKEVFIKNEYSDPKDKKETLHIKKILGGGNSLLDFVFFKFFA